MLAAVALTVALESLGSTPCDSQAHCQQELARTNDSAHAAWAVAMPLAGYAVASKKGALVSGGAWMAWTLVNEYALHGKESTQERQQNLKFRLIPCALTLGLLLALPEMRW